MAGLASLNPPTENFVFDAERRGRHSQIEFRNEKREKSLNCDRVEYNLKMT